jgi:hypothetical protein
VVTSPLFLKLLGLSYGINIQESSEFKDKPIIINLPHGVRFLVVPAEKSDGILSLTRIKDNYYLQYLDNNYPVKIHEPPSIEKLNDFVIASGSSLFISPAGNANSIYSPEIVKISSEKKNQELNIEKFIDEITPFFKKFNFETAFFVDTGSNDEDGGIFKLQPYIRLISKNFKVLIGARVSVPKKKEWIDWTYAIGVDIICYDLLCYNKKYYVKYYAHKGEHESIIESLIYATTVFPKGCVMTHLIAGFEPPESTIEGIEFLSSKGIIPILKTDPSSNLPLKTLLSLYEKLTKTIKKYRINPGHTGNMDHILTPAELSNLTLSKIAGKGSIYTNFSKKLLNSAIRNMYKIRRNLMVREVK